VKNATPEMRELLARCADDDLAIASAAGRQLALALTTPIREAVFNGPIIGGIFTPEDYPAGVNPEYPKDLVAPGSEGDWIAYVMPNHGYIPQKAVESDYVMVPFYYLAHAIDWSMQYSKDARWNIVDRALEVLVAGFTRKLNTDAFRTLMASAASRGFIVNDSAASQGYFSKTLVSNLKTKMKREGGGNSASPNQGKLTDLFLSIEAMEDLRSWSSTDVDDFTRREIFTAQDGLISRVFSTNLHETFELGTVAYEFTKYWLAATPAGIGQTLASSDDELVIGLDMTRKNSSLVMPMREPLALFDDSVNLHRHNKQGWYGRWRGGFSALDNRVVIAGSL
jgi:hypothetical protein